MTYREITKKLKELGCRFYRQGKEDHEIWVNPKGARFPISKRMHNSRLHKILLKQAVMEVRYG